MAIHGKIKLFRLSVYDWTLYKEKLQFYFDANSIATESEKRSVLVTVCGDATFKLLHSLVPAGKLDTEAITYMSLVALLKDYYRPKQLVMVNRCKFNTHSRRHGESIGDYVVALRDLALNCKFGSTAQLEEMLRDWLVCGVNHSGIQRTLLAEGELTYSSTLKLAQTVEASEQDAKKLSDGDSQHPTQGSSTDLHYTSSSRRMEGTPLSATVAADPNWPLNASTKTLSVITAKRRAILPMCVSPMHHKPNPTSLRGIRTPNLNEHITSKKSHLPPKLSTICTTVTLKPP